MSDDDRPSTLFERLREAFVRGGEAEESTDVDPQRRAAARSRLSRAAAFEGIRVDDVMVPRADIIALPIDASLAEVARAFGEAAHSRMPVYRDSLDETVGMVHIRDVVRYLTPELGNGESRRDAQILPTVLRPLLFVPPSMRASDLLLRMQSRRLHMAVVVDEFGGVDGLVTLEDLVEQIVGDISDEHDVDETPSIRARGPKTWEADARVTIETLEGLAGRMLDLPDDELDEVDTLGGLVFTLAGRVPERGEVISHPSGFEFEVVDADPRRVKRLVVRAFVTEAPSAGEGSKNSPGTENASETQSRDETSGESSAEPSRADALGFGS